MGIYIFLCFLHSLSKKFKVAIPGMEEESEVHSEKVINKKYIIT